MNILSKAIKTSEVIAYDDLGTEAIRKLELEGLVIMVPRKGAEVADITEKDLRDVLEVRTALEELSIELAMKNMTGDDFKALMLLAGTIPTLEDCEDIRCLFAAYMLQMRILIFGGQTKTSHEIFNMIRFH